MIILALALYGMKDEDNASIYLIVDDFEQVSRTVNSKPQVFVLVTFPFKGPSYR
jgi:hypothetical protein